MKKPCDCPTLTDPPPTAEPTANASSVDSPPSYDVRIVIEVHEVNPAGYAACAKFVVDPPKDQNQLPRLPSALGATVEEAARFAFEMVVSLRARRKLESQFMADVLSTSPSSPEYMVCQLIDSMSGNLAQARMIDVAIQNTVEVVVVERRQVSVDFSDLRAPLLSAKVNAS